MRKRVRPWPQSALHGQELGSDEEGRVLQEKDFVLSLDGKELSEDDLSRMRDTETPRVAAWKQGRNNAVTASNRLQATCSRVPEARSWAARVESVIGEEGLEKASARRWVTIAGRTVIGISALLYLRSAYKLSGAVSISDAGVACASVLIAAGLYWLASVVPLLWFRRMTFLISVVSVLALILYIASDSSLADLVWMTALGLGLATEGIRKERKVEE